MSHDFTSDCAVSPFRIGNAVSAAGVQSTANVAGFHVFNGDGTGTDFVTFSVNGVNQNAPSPVHFTYTLNSDCTGTLSVHNGPNLDIFAAVDGSALTTIDTDPGVAFAQGPEPLVGFAW